VTNPQVMSWGVKPTRFAADSSGQWLGSLAGRNTASPGEEAAVVQFGEPHAPGEARRSYPQGPLSVIGEPLDTAQIDAPMFVKAFFSLLFRQGNGVC